MKGFLQGLAGRSGGAESAAEHGSARVIAPHDATRRLELLDDFERAGFGWLWATDAAGRLIYISSSAAEKLGHPLDEVLAQPFVALFETDPDNPDERSDRPLKLRLSARN